MKIRILIVLSLGLLPFVGLAYGHTLLGSVVLLVAVMLLTIGRPRLLRRVQRRPGAQGFVTPWNRRQGQNRDQRNRPERGESKWFGAVALSIRRDINRSDSRSRRDTRRSHSPQRRCCSSIWAIGPAFQHI